MATNVRGDLSQGAFFRAARSVAIFGETLTGFPRGGSSPDATDALARRDHPTYGLGCASEKSNGFSSSASVTAFLRFLFISNPLASSGEPCGDDPYGIASLDKDDQQHEPLA